MGVMRSGNADAVPPSITTLINRHYGHESSEQQLDIPLWFVGKMTADEVCKEDVVLACFASQFKVLLLKVPLLCLQIYSMLFCCFVLIFFSKAEQMLRNKRNGSFVVRCKSCYTCRTCPTPRVGRV